MVDEDYERLFRVALRPRRYRYAKDDGLVSRGFLVCGPKPSSGNARVYLTVMGRDRLTETIARATAV